MHLQPNRDKLKRFLEQPLMLLEIKTMQFSNCMLMRSGAHAGGLSAHGWF
jgi:hypothetical protein